MLLGRSGLLLKTSGLSHSSGRGHVMMCATPRSFFLSLLFLLGLPLSLSGFIIVPLCPLAAPAHHTLVKYPWGVEYIPSKAIDLLPEADFLVCGPEQHQLFNQKKQQNTKQQQPSLHINHGPNIKP